MDSRAAGCLSFWCVFSSAHRFFFTRLANFYSVAKKPSNFAITRLKNRVLKTEYFSEKWVKPSIEKPSTFLEKGQNRVKKTEYFLGILPNRVKCNRVLFENMAKTE